MKKNITPLICLLLVLLVSTLNAQNSRDYNFGFLTSPSESPLFGKDIVINDSPTQNQNHVAICSAFNGWLYALYNYRDEITTHASFTLMKSIDKGLTWTLMDNASYPIDNSDFTSTNLVATGNSLQTLKVFSALVVTGSSTGIGNAFVIRYNGETGAFEERILEEPEIYKIAIASDKLYPANNGNLNTLGVIYSKYYTTKDSLIFRSSSNNGVSLDGRQVVAVSIKRFHNVAISYGRSPSWNSGRYFVTWEVNDDFGPMLGHIYTAHSNPNFNSPFSSPVNLDSLNVTNIKSCRNPAIACQYSNIDNDSSNLTQMVVFESFNQSLQRYNVIGYFNLQATTSQHFKNLNISNAQQNTLEPDLCFNPFDSTFMLTYFNSTEKKLPFFTNNFNLRNPNSWATVSTGYNDSSVITSPIPRINLDFEQHKGINVWSSLTSGDNGIATFDAQYSTFTGILESDNNLRSNSCSVFPNPCSNKISFAFELDNDDEISINLFTVLGQPLKAILNQRLSKGWNKVDCDVSDIKPGCYLYILRTGKYTVSGKIYIIRG